MLFIKKFPPPLAFFPIPFYCINNVFLAKEIAKKTSGNKHRQINSCLDCRHIFIFPPSFETILENVRSPWAG
jgi:hypothetical protein